MQTKERRLGAAALAACVLGISFSATLNKLASAAGLHPVWVNVLRLGIAVICMLPTLVMHPGAFRQLRGLDRHARGLMLLSGGMLGIHFAAWTAALSLVDSVVAVSIWSTFSLMTVVGSQLFLKERTPPSALLGIILATAGVAICALGATGMQRTGVVLALVAALAQAVYTLCGRAVRRTVDTLPYTTVVYSVAFLCLLASALVLKIPPAGFNAQELAAATALALLCTIGGHSMQNYALRHFKAPTVSIIGLTEVITGPLLVYLLLGEAPSPQNLIGGAIILAGVAWYMLSEFRHPQRKSQEKIHPEKGADS